MESEKKEAGLRRVQASEARALLKEQEGSGMSIAAFARGRGVEPWTLYNARAVARRKERREPKRTFAAVSVINDVGSEEAPIEITLLSGLTLRVTRGFDEVTLRRLLGVIAGC
jgi:hypothetical protein